MTKKINKPQDFVGKYINLNNTKLNGEFTLTDFHKLKECFRNLGFEFKGFRERNYPSYIRFCYKFYPPALCNAHDLKDEKEEVSIYDIKGMDKPTAKPKIKTTHTKPTSIQANNEMEEIRVNTPFFVPTEDVIDYPCKYTIDDLKTKKIAVHLPTKSDFDKAMKFFGQNGIRWYEGQHADNLSYKDILEDMYYWQTQQELHVFIYCKCLRYGSVNRDVPDGFVPVRGYTIITLDQLQTDDIILTFDESASISKKALEGLEPTAEEKLANRLRLSKEQIAEGMAKGQIVEIPNHDNNGMSFDFSDNPEIEEVIIKYQGKEKVITRDDFAKDIDVPSKYPKGSRMWMFKMLNKGKKIRLKSWEKDKFTQLPEEAHGMNHVLIDECGRLYADMYIPKDGWELYKEEPKKKTMTLGEAIEQNRNFKFKDDTYFLSWGQCKRKRGGRVSNLPWILDNLDEQVEIIIED